MTIDEVTPRRERVRLETTAEIKSRTWALLADDGIDALSLREVARQMGMAPSAIYRYFPSRNYLITELIVDGFTGLATTVSVTRTRSQAAGLDAVETWLAVAMAYRAWARANPTVFALIYSTSIPDYHGTPATTAAASGVGDALLEVMGDMVEEGVIDLDGLAAGINATLSSELTVWSAHGGHGLPPPALAGALRCYATLHGLIHLEMNGHYPHPLQGSDALFESTIRALTSALRHTTPAPID